MTVPLARRDHVQRDRLHPGVAAYQRASRELPGEGADRGEDAPLLARAGWAWGFTLAGAALVVETGEHWQAWWHLTVGLSLGGAFLAVGLWHAVKGYYDTVAHNDQ